MGLKDVCLGGLFEKTCQQTIYATLPLCEAKQKPSATAAWPALQLMEKRGEHHATDPRGGNMAHSAGWVEPC